MTSFDAPKAYALGIATILRCHAAISEPSEKTPVLTRIAVALECLDGITASDLPPFVEPYFSNVTQLADRVRDGATESVPAFFRGIETLADQLQWFVERNGGGAIGMIRALRKP